MNKRGKVKLCHSRWLFRMEMFSSLTTHFSLSDYFLTISFPNICFIMKNIKRDRKYWHTSFRELLSTEGFSDCVLDWSQEPTGGIGNFFRWPRLISNFNPVCVELSYWDKLLCARQVLFDVLKKVDEIMEQVNTVFDCLERAWARVWVWVWVWDTSLIQQSLVYK